MKLKKQKAVLLFHQACVGERWSGPVLTGLAPLIAGLSQNCWNQTLSLNFCALSPAAARCHLTAQFLSCAAPLAQLRSFPGSAP